MGAGANGGSGGALVVDAEHRRRSGRAVRVRFVLEGAKDGVRDASVVLLREYAGFARRADDGGSVGAEERLEATFELGLTQRQRVARDGVVLPYFDAQGEEGPGEGGRIVYDMGVEDDFDEEEDEI